MDAVQEMARRRHAAAARPVDREVVQHLDLVFPTHRSVVEIAIRKTQQGHR
jgi:hypothetical protein